MELIRVYQNEDLNYLNREQVFKPIIPIYTINNDVIKEKDYSLITCTEKKSSHQVLDYSMSNSNENKLMEPIAEIKHVDNMNKEIISQMKMYDHSLNSAEVNSTLNDINLRERAKTTNGSTKNKDYVESVSLEQKFQEVIQKYFKSPFSTLKLVLDDPKFDIELFNTEQEKHCTKMFDEKLNLKLKELSFDKINGLSKCANTNSAYIEEIHSDFDSFTEEVTPPHSIQKPSSTEEFMPFAEEIDKTR